LLQYLCGFFHEVIANTEANRMNVENLAIIFGPSFLGELGSDDDPLATAGVSKAIVLQQMQLLNTITAFLICNFQGIFRVWRASFTQHVIPISLSLSLCLCLSPLTTLLTY
jgi:hypothetical protein